MVLHMVFDMISFTKFSGAIWLLLFGPAGPEVVGTGGCWRLLGGDGFRLLLATAAGKAASLATTLVMDGLRSWRCCGDGGDLVLFTLASAVDANDGSLEGMAKPPDAALLLPLASNAIKENHVTTSIIYNSIESRKKNPRVRTKRHHDSVKSKLETTWKFYKSKTCRWMLPRSV